MESRLLEDNNLVKKRKEINHWELDRTDKKIGNCAEAGKIELQRKKRGSLEDSYQLPRRGVYPY